MATSKKHPANVEKESNVDRPGDSSIEKNNNAQKGREPNVNSQNEIHDEQSEDSNELPENTRPKGMDA